MSLPIKQFEYDAHGVRASVSLLPATGDSREYIVTLQHPAIAKAEKKVRIPSAIMQMPPDRQKKEIAYQIHAELRRFCKQNNIKTTY